MWKLLKRLFSVFFLGKKAQKEVPIPNPKEQPTHYPPIEKKIIPQKQKEQKVHRIPPDYMSAPKTFYFSKSKGLQQIFWWDGDYFPGRWRHKLIHH